MRYARAHWWSPCFAIVICATPVLGQAAPDKAVGLPAYRARVLGVFDEASGAPLEGVRVINMQNGTFAQTTPTGTVSLSYLPEGGSLVRLQKIGYQTQTFLVAISPSDTTAITAVMKTVTQLPTMVTRESGRTYISPNLRNFEERKTENGYFLGEQDLRKNDDRPLATLLEGSMPSIQLVAGSASAYYLMRSPRCSSGGPPQVYLDGVPINSIDPYAPSQSSQRFERTAPRTAARIDPDVPRAFNLSDFPVNTLGAVEWYPDGDTVPIEFGHTSNRCGALLLWTRER